MPWRSTLRGVVVARDVDDVVLLEGMAAACWMLLGSGDLDLGQANDPSPTDPAIDPVLAAKTLEMMRAEGLVES